LLNRIESRESTLHAWQFLDPDNVLAQTKKPPNFGPLAGVPVGVKDLFDTGDMPTTYGSPIYADYRPARDAISVARLRQAGAVIMGKTVTTQFAAVFEAGKTVNPYASSRSPGGSSSGSAAAVADRMVPLAIGTQTGGSVIRPAAYCGTLGFKPTFGAIGRTGVKPVSPSLDTIGMFARSSEDLLLLYSVMFGLDPQDQATMWTAHAPLPTGTNLVLPLRIAYVRTGNWTHAERATREALDSAALAVAKSGAQVAEVTLPALFDELVEASHVVDDFELARALSTEYALHRDMLLPSLIKSIEVGRQIDDDRYHRSLRLAEQCRRLLASIFEGHDVILTPATLGEAPQVETTGDPLFCRSWTLLGNPTVTVPGLRGPSGLPVGIQLVGHRYQDASLLSIADWVAQCLPTLRPPSRRRTLAKDGPSAASGSGD
jgi:Asp-tRNA(Asn)/Glu-tRNA(Gln) amidotransferase A subunit family amidase